MADGDIGSSVVVEAIQERPARPAGLAIGTEPTDACLCRHIREPALSDVLRQLVPATSNKQEINTSVAVQALGAHPARMPMEP